MNEGGNIHYACGHVLHDPEVPQDTDWASEVECPNCANLGKQMVYIVAETDGYDAFSNEAVFANREDAEAFAAKKPQVERGDFYIIQEFELRGSGK